MANNLKRTPNWTNVQVTNKKARWGGPALSQKLILVMLKNAFSDRSTAFFKSDPNIDEDDASSWQFVKPLGTGSYGTVAVWTRKDQSEFCAVKDEEYRPPQQQYGNEREGEDYEGMYQGIVKEAV
jgi:hypothetical protein